ncbi:hypothetical protein AHAS_Ahas17G0065600 [Arachis hypogaea]
MKMWVEWDDHNTTAYSPTFQFNADNIVNAYNNPINTDTRVLAVVAMISGDKSYFYRVVFFGFQDILWDNHERHYYKLCIIQCAVDFIFGVGQSL